MTRLSIVVALAAAVCLPELRADDQLAQIQDSSDQGPAFTVPPAPAPPAEPSAGAPLPPMPSSPAPGRSFSQPGGVIPLVPQTVPPQTVPPQFGPPQFGQPQTGPQIAPPPLSVPPLPLPPQSMPQQSMPQQIYPQQAVPPGIGSPWGAPGGAIPILPQGAQPPAGTYYTPPGTEIPFGPPGSQPMMVAPFQEGSTSGNGDPSRLRITEPPPDQSEMATGERPETPPAAASALVFRTREVLRPDVLRGPNYRLGDYAPLVNYRFEFRIETPWGTIPAHGLAMLELRLRELHAIEYASRIANKNPMWVEGVWQVGARTPEGAFIAVTDPIGSFYRTACALKRIAMAKTSPGGVRGNCESRRRIACLVHCDPESRNPVLQCLLDTMSTNATAGWLAADAALDFGFPGIGCLAANAEFKQMMTIPSTSDVNEQLDTELQNLGVPQEVRKKFLNCPSYTMTQRMASVYWLQNLVGIDGLPTIVRGAAEAKDESEALASMQELQLIAELRRTRTIVHAGFVGLSFIRLFDGSQMIVTADDYIVPTPAIAQLVGRYRQQFPTVPTTLVTLGRVSWEAERQLQAEGISVAQFKLRGPTEAKAPKPTQTAMAPGSAAPGPRTQ